MTKDDLPFILTTILNREAEADWEDNVRKSLSVPSTAVTVSHGRHAYCGRI